MKNRQTFFDPLASLCMFIILFISALRLVETKWAAGLLEVIQAVLLGGLLGLALGASRFRRGATFWLGSAYAVHMLAWIFTRIDTTNGLGWAEQIWNLFIRNREGFALFIQNRPVQDSILFVTLMVLLYGGLGFGAGFGLGRRSNPWPALLVTGLVVAIAEVFPPPVKYHHLYNAGFVFFGLVLLVRTYNLSLQREWQVRNAQVDYGVGFDMLRNALLAGLLVLIFAWNLPSFVETFTPGSEAHGHWVEFWKPARNRLSKMFAGLRGEQTLTSELLGDQIVLGDNISQSQRVLFSVTPLDERPSGMRYYWRGASYDRYQNGIWDNTIRDRQKKQASEAQAVFPDWQERRRQGFKIEYYDPDQPVIFAPGYPVMVSRPALWRVEKMDTSGMLVDVLQISPAAELKRGEQVRVESLMSIPLAPQLSAAGEDYPEWVQEHYLQLPAVLPERVRALATQIAGDLQSPYEKTMAVTAYLRETITYGNQVTPAPPGKEPLDWFLFETKSGYCNYSATAEVILLRSLGIPARLAVGFAEGYYDEEEERFDVRMKDYHAWAEVYFSGLGWVEFEPTSSQPMPLQLSMLSRPEESQALSAAQAFGPPVKPPRPDDEELTGEGSGWSVAQKNIQPGFYWAGLAGLGAVVVGVYVFWRRKWKNKAGLFLPERIKALIQKRRGEVPAWLNAWVYWTHLPPLERYFLQVDWMLRWLRMESFAGQTPAERIALLVETLPQAGGPATELLAEYEKAAFSPYPADGERARRAYLNLWKMVIRAGLTSGRGVLRPNRSDYLR